MPTPTCDYEHETWGPHPGCREFMSEPETWPCGAPATTVILSDLPAEGMAGPADFWANQRTLACDEHAALYADDGFGFTNTRQARVLAVRPTRRRAPATAPEYGAAWATTQGHKATAAEAAHVEAARAFVARHAGETRHMLRLALDGAGYADIALTDGTAR